MTFPSGFDIARGLAPGCVSSFRFGRNTAIGLSYTPVTRSGFCRTPQSTAALAQRVKTGGDANDAALGFGARNIALISLDASGNDITDLLATVEFTLR